ncbi:hypothetical protein N7491_008914, partial [Penicillium cf. griseofulvum]
MRSSTFGNQTHKLSSNSFNQLKASIENLTAIVQGDHSYPLRNIQVNVTHTDLTLIFAHNYVTSQPRNTSTDLHMNDLSLNFEGLWRYGPVMHKVTKYDLVGRPDYSLWYGYEEDVAV